MKHVIEIDYDPERMRANHERLSAIYSGLPADRVPVIMGMEARYTLQERKSSFAKYYRDPTTHLIEQLENFKWVVHHVDDDRLTGYAVAAFPDFQNTVGAAGFGAEIIWQEHEVPCVRPCIHSVEAMENWPMPDIHSGFWAKKIRWFYEMKEAAEEVTALINGRVVPIHVFLNIGGEGPFQIAVDLVGEDFYWWLYEYPEACHRFLRKITYGKMQFEDLCRRLSPGGGEYWYSEDSAQMISEAMYREFCVPYDEALYSRYGGRRVMHLCGSSLHLHRLLVEELKIDVFHGLNHAVPLAEVKKTLKPYTVVIGNLNPLTLLNGTPQDVEEEVLDCISNLAPGGRLVISDGYGIMPGTPLCNINRVADVSRKLGRQAFDREQNI